MHNIVSKIRKLLAVAESAEGHEAETAFALAEKLIRQHAVDMSQLKEAERNEQDPMGTYEIVVNQAAWRADLAWAIAAHCSVSALRRRVSCFLGPARVMMVGYGRRSDLAVWEYLYTVALRQIEASARAYRARHAGEWDIRSRMFDFRSSAVRGLRAKLAAQRQAAAQQDTTGTALVRTRGAEAKAARDAANPKVGTFRGGQRYHSQEGWEAGRNVQLDPGLTRSPNAKAIE